MYTHVKKCAPSWKNVHPREKMYTPVKKSCAFYLLQLTKTFHFFLLPSKKLSFFRHTSVSSTYPCKLVSCRCCRCCLWEGLETTWEWRVWAHGYLKNPPVKRSVAIKSGASKVIAQVNNQLLWVKSLGPRVTENPPVKRSVTIKVAQLNIQLLSKWIVCYGFCSIFFCMFSIIDLILCFSDCEMSAPVVMKLITCHFE